MVHTYSALRLRLSLVATMVMVAIPIATTMPVSLGSCSSQTPNHNVTARAVLDHNDAQYQSRASEEGQPQGVSAMDRVKQLLSKVPLIDAHNDLAMQFRVKVQNHVNSINLTQDVNVQWGNSHTDIPRLRTGQIGAQFWSCYVLCSTQGSDAVRVGLDQLDTIKRFVTEYSDTFTFVTTAQGIMDAFNMGKIGSLVGLESGHSIDSSLSTLRMFHDLGVRYMTLTHNCNTPWADSSTQDDQPDRPGGHGGLTEFGKLVVWEMNRLGMMVDLSHVSHDTMSDTLNITSAPVIFSHSSAWALCHHNRNVRDDILRRLAANNGIIMVNFWNTLINCEPNYQEVPSLSQVADHIEYIHRVAGPDHVGIGADYDGVSYKEVPADLKDVSYYPELFAELASRGWTDEHLEKLASKNLIRVFTDVEKERDRLSGTVKPYDNLIPEVDLGQSICRPDF